MITEMPPVPPSAIIAVPAAAAIEARNAAAVHAAFARWTAGDGSVFELLASDFIWTIEGSGPLAGSYDRASFARLLAPFNANLARPLTPTLTSLLAKGDQVVVRFTATAPMRSGGDYRNSYAWFLTLRNGKIDTVTAFLDLQAFERVHGADAVR